MALTKIGTGGIKDDAASQAAIADEAVDEARLQISNAGSNGQFLQKQSGNTGGLTWATAGGVSSIADDSITEVKLDIHADPSGTDKFLAYTSNGMEWAVPTDTNTQLSTEQVQDIVGAMFTGNTETNITATYQDSDGTIDLVSTDTNTQLSTEEVQDIVGAMFTGNTETNITATYEDSDGTIDLVSTNTQVGGATGVDFNDDVKARFGTGNDLEIYHNATNSLIQNTTGYLGIRSNTLYLQDNNGSGHAYITCIADGAVGLRHDNLEKLITTANGVTVTGTVTDDKGELRTIPQLSKSSKHTIVLADAGKHSINSSGGWEFDTSTAFTAGMAITLINNSGSDQTIEADGVTLYNTADAATGNRTLAGRGMATVICTASNTYYISGAGLS